MKKQILDSKPKVGKIDSETVDRQYTMTINAGQWMGFLLFTYPAGFTVTSRKAP